MSQHKKAQLNSHVPPVLREKVEALADEKEWSVSKMAGVLISEAVTAREAVAVNTDTLQKR